MCGGALKDQDLDLEDGDPGFISVLKRAQDGSLQLPPAADVFADTTFHYIQFL